MKKMGKRAIERKMARALYDKFSEKWRNEQRLVRITGGKKAHRKPVFRAWYAMHMRDLAMMRQSTPTDVREYMGIDPWEPEPHVSATSREDSADRSDRIDPLSAEDGIVAAIDLPMRVR